MAYPDTEKTASAAAVIFTAGHSTRSLDEFLAMLQAHNIKLLADVRTIPRSRHNPQFNRETFGSVLSSHGISYLHMKALGGLRHAKAGSVNTGLLNPSFRGYADYMQTQEFAAALQSLIDLAQDTATAIMCAEAVPWRCHRSMIADALTVKGIVVVHILSAAGTRPHTLTPLAKVTGIQVTYPGQAALV
ncbi:MAG: DUF488 domain-containing protein [Proteobacteria bacterium]|nr:DUF488 domain-containing protein [Pseudomonadota bacterium]